MDKLMDFFNNIDWLFAAVLLIGGRYWGRKYFRISKNPDINFLVFATLFGSIWLIIQKTTGEFSKAQVSQLFLTYLFVTSFYQLLAKQIFEWLEKMAGVKSLGDGEEEEYPIYHYQNKNLFPTTGQNDIWYLDSSTGEYYYWDGVKNTYGKASGGDRPPNKPPNP